MFTLQESPIDIAKLKDAHSGPNNGAMVAFEGIVRADTKTACSPKLNAETSQRRRVSSLTYIADAPVCNAEGAKIIKECLSLFPVTYAVCVQRIGQVHVGETAIWIGVWAGHRDEAFKGCRHIIEEVKKRLLIWKKEHYADGSSAWIHGQQTVTS